MGATILHGPHHSAQKSTSTGSSAAPISSSKVESDKVVTVGAMGCSFRVRVELAIKPDAFRTRV
jgi:hypothetical protein